MVHHYEKISHFLLARHTKPQQVWQDVFYNKKDFDGTKAHEVAIYEKS